MGNTASENTSPRPVCFRRVGGVMLRRAWRRLVARERQAGVGSSRKVRRGGMYSGQFCVRRFVY